MGQQQPWAAFQGNGQYQATGVVYHGWPVAGSGVTLDQVEYIIPFTVPIRVPAVNHQWRDQHNAKEGLNDTAAT